MDKFTKLRCAGIGLTVVISVQLVSMCAAAANGIEAGLIRNRDEHCNPSVAYTWIQVMLDASGRSVDRYVRAADHHFARNGHSDHGDV